MAQEKEVNFRYIQSKDYRIAPATGAWGGVTPSGQVLANVFCELLQPLEAETYRVSPDGRLQKPTEQVHRDEDGIWFERRVEIGLLMSPSDARNIATWLVAKAEQAERLQQEVNDGK